VSLLVVWRLLLLWNMILLLIPHRRVDTRLALIGSGLAVGGGDSQWRGGRFLLVARPL
jgi:hypothetical protein